MVAAGTEGKEEGASGKGEKGHGSKHQTSG
jgi:hypothetical protein